MSTLTVTTKGQVTLRKDLLAHLGIRPGARVTVTKLNDGRLEIRAEGKRGKITDVFNLLKQPDGPTLSIGEMNAIATKGWAGRS